MNNIITITMNPCIDKSTSVDNVVAERKLRCARPTYEPGGGGINVSRALKRLGEESTALYPAGGAVGDMLEGLLDQEHLIQKPFEIKALTRESFIVYEESSNQQYRFGMPGPEIRETEWQGFMDRLKQTDFKPDYIICSGSLPPGVPEDFYAGVSKWGKAHSAKTIVDTTGKPLASACMEGVFLVKPNLRELEIIEGEAIESEHQQESIARRLVEERCCEVVVVSLGAAGALLVWKGGVERVRAPTVPIKSKVGAGDSMVAGITAALARTWDLPDAVRFGVAAGAAAVMTQGTELCRREDTERLYEQIRNS